MKKIFRDPLFHFFILGIVIYALYFLFAGNSNDNSQENTIVVSTGEVTWMRDTWTKKMNRPPTQEELEAMINSNVEETVLYKEALKMGLDADDVIIRRRLSQKLRFLQEDLVKPQNPSDEELNTFFNTHINRYQADQKITVTQIFFDPDKREETTLEDAKLTMAILNKMNFNKVNSNEYGDRFMLQSYYPNRTEVEMAKLFGSEFAKSIFQLDTGKWHGPILSGYGTHLVYIEQKLDPPTPNLESVRDLVLDDWKVYKQEEINRLFIEGLLARYTVIIESTDSESSTTTNSNPG